MKAFLASPSVSFMCIADAIVLSDHSFKNLSSIPLFFLYYLSLLISNTTLIQTKL